MSHKIFMIYDSRRGAKPAYHVIRQVNRQAGTDIASAMASICNEALEHIAEKICDNYD